MVTCLLPPPGLSIPPWIARRGPVRPPSPSHPSWWAPVRPRLPSRSLKAFAVQGRRTRTAGACLEGQAPDQDHQPDEHDAQDNKPGGVDLSRELFFSALDL